MSSSKDLDVVTVGHVLMDIRFVVDRFASPDEEAAIKHQTRNVGGCAANVAIGVKKLGGRSGAIAKIGFDSFGRAVMEELMREGVDVSGIRIGMGPTGFSIVIIDSKGKIAIYGFKGVAEELHPSEIDEALIARAKFVHIASLRIDTSITAAELAKKHGAKVSWDPGRRLSQLGLEKLSELVKKVDIVLVNEEECFNLTHERDYKKGARIIKDLGPSLVVVKRGAKGIYSLSDEFEAEMPALPVDRVIDTTGAGDAFAAGLLMGLCRGYRLKRALIYALAVASLKVTRLGSHAIPSHEETVRYLWEHYEPE